MYERAKKILGKVSGGDDFDGDFMAPSEQDGGIKKLTPEMVKLLMEEAEWKTNNGDHKGAARLFIQAKKHDKAIEIYGTQKMAADLISKLHRIYIIITAIGVCRQLDKSSHKEEIKLAAYHFRKMGEHAHANEAYLKLGDIKSQMHLHIELEKWEEAFTLANKNPDLAAMVRLPYANFLVREDRFEEAIEGYKKANRPDLSTNILKQLSKNATVERRFQDAGHFFWLLAIENLR